MSFPRRSQNQPASGRAVKLAVLWSIISLVLGGAGAAAYTILNRPLDAFALCEAGTRIAVSTVVLVDTTDVLTEIQRRRARVAIENERDALPRGGKLTIATINENDPGQPVEVVSACNPGRASEANPLFVTVSQVDKRWAEDFMRPVDAAILRATKAPDAGSSPIIATVAALTTRPDFDARVPERRLVIVSDMLEHQKGAYSHLAGGDFWRAYKASALPRLVPLDLRGVSVAIDYLARPPYAAAQGTPHRGFWLRLLTEAGAADVTFIGMQRDTAPADAASATGASPPRRTSP